MISSTESPEYNQLCASPTSQSKYMITRANKQSSHAAVLIVTVKRLILTCILVNKIKAQYYLKPMTGIVPNIDLDGYINQISEVKQVSGDTFGFLVSSTKSLRYITLLISSAATSFTVNASGKRLWDSSMNQYTISNMVLADRKSTRLNSSHSQISYAVFFFK